ncbi:MAG: MATE family efflux transporter [Acetatifactor sp.]|nr:MATE family efflux transporter [Acetatifactor sp.]
MPEQKQAQFQKMTETPVEKLLISLAIPTILTMMVTTIYNVADSAFVGTLGTSQSGATGIIGGFMAIIQALGFMCGQGAGSIMSRKLGNQNEEEASRYTSTGVLFSFSLGLLLTIIGFVFTEPLLYLLGSTDTILPYAKEYLFYILLATPFFTSSFTMNNMLRYEGKAKFGMIAMLSGSILNIIGDAVLMMGFHMGIKGAGLSTAISQTVSFSLLLFMFLSGRTVTKLSVRYVSAKISTYMEIATTGFPSLLRQSLNSVATMMLNNYAGVYGDAAVSAMSIVSRLSFFPMAVAIGIGQGFQPISGFNFGAGKKDRVKRAFNKALLGGEAAVFLISIPLFLFAGTFVGFLRNDAEVIKIGESALRYMCVGQMFVPLTMMIEMGFQSIGEKMLASLGSSLRSGLLFIPSLMILSNMFGLLGVQIAQPVSFLLTFGICLYLLKLYFRRIS